MSEHNSSQQKKVYLYIIVLFTAAFLLILWSFLATHRSNQQVLDEVRGNADIVETVLDENMSLGEKNEALEAENEALQAALSKLEADYQALDTERIAAQESSAAVICAMDWLREIQSLYESKNFSSARSMILEFEDNLLPAHLPTAPLHTYDGNDAEAPADTYAAIVTALFPNGIA